MTNKITEAVALFDENDRRTIRRYLKALAADEATVKWMAWAICEKWAETSDYPAADLWAMNTLGERMFKELARAALAALQEQSDG